jgi:hypothetical protein
MIECAQGQRHIKLLATEVTRMRAEIQVGLLPFLLQNPNQIPVSLCPPHSLFFLIFIGSTRVTAIRLLVVTIFLSNSRMRCIVSTRAFAGARG